MCSSGKKLSYVKKRQDKKKYSGKKILVCKVPFSIKKIRAQGFVNILSGFLCDIFLNGDQNSNWIKFVLFCVCLIII